MELVGETKEWDLEGRRIKDVLACSLCDMSKLTDKEEAFAIQMFRPMLPTAAAEGGSADAYEGGAGPLTRARLEDGGGDGGNSLTQLSMWSANTASTAAMATAIATDRRSSVTFPTASVNLIYI
jgi:hypothetical protein